MGLWSSGVVCMVKEGSFFLQMTECLYMYPSQSIDTDNFSAQCILISKHAFIAGINRFAVSLQWTRPIICESYSHIYMQLWNLVKLWLY